MLSSVPRGISSRVAIPMQARIPQRYFSGSSKPGGREDGGGHKGPGNGEGEIPSDGGVSWKTFVPLALLFGGGAAYLSIRNYERSLTRKGAARPAGKGREDGEDASVNVEAATGKVDLGGPWRLMDHDAKVRTRGQCCQGY